MFLRHLYAHSPASKIKKNIFFAQTHGPQPELVLRPGRQRARAHAHLRGGGPKGGRAGVGGRAGKERSDGIK